DRMIFAFCFDWSNLDSHRFSIKFGLTKSCDSPPISYAPAERSAYVPTTYTMAPALLKHSGGEHNQRKSRRQNERQEIDRCPRRNFIGRASLCRPFSARGSQTACLHRTV